MHKTLASFLGALLFAPHLAFALTADSHKRIVRQVETYINAITTMRGSFTQDGPQRNQDIFRFSRGNFWISRPGKMKFSYTQPQKINVIADGVWLAVQSQPGGIYERYPLDATPAKFILRGNLNIARTARIENLTRSNNKISLWLVAKNNALAGKIKLRFSENPLTLQGWTIIDAQGLTTQVRLKNVIRGGALDPALFFIENKTLFKRKKR